MPDSPKHGKVDMVTKASFIKGVVWGILFIIYFIHKG